MKSYKELKYCYEYFSRFAWGNNKSFFVFIILRFIIRSIGPFISIIGTRYLIDKLISSNREVSCLIFWIGFLCIGNFIYQNAIKIVDENIGRINENFGRILETKLSMCCVNMKFENTENEKVLDIIQNAQRALNETGQVNGLIGPLFDIVANIIVLLGVITLVCTSIPWLLIPVVLSFVCKSFAGKKINKQRGEYFSKIGRVERGADYYNTELQDGRYAKDIRIYETTDIFNKNFNGFVEQYFNYAKHYLLKLAAIFSLEDTVVNICTVVIYFILGIYTLFEYITIGQFSSLYQATQQFNNSLHGIVRRYINITYTVSVLKYYVDFVGQEQSLCEKSREGSYESLCERKNKDFSVEFKNVSFNYPRTKKYILKNISIKINQGEHLSIVGENGTGKTTFIKLLCKLYDDYEGEIIVNGKEIREYSFKEYMRLLSVVFQDFKLFAFTLKENITMFNESEENLKKIYDISGISKWIEELEDSEDTYIYKYFVENGIEPSGGESQKMAIARALYKNAPIVILDEPTAALDPIAEYEVYKNFDKLVYGKTAIYISHRLSSCKFCDRIIVFNNGSIIEEGSHDELMKNTCGLYYNMYSTQAKHYK